MQERRVQERADSRGEVALEGLRDLHLAAADAHEAHAWPAADLEKHAEREGACSYFIPSKSTCIYTPFLASRPVFSASVSERC